MRRPYREEQRPARVWWLLAAGVGAVTLTSVVLEGSRDPASGPATVLALAVGLGIPVWLGRMRLMTAVFEDRVEVRVRGLWRRTIPMREIAGAAARQYRPIAEFGGWGIRYGRGGWAYTMRGKRGVQLQLRKGRPVLIGSDDPARLAEAITSSAQYNPSSGGYSSAG